MPGFDGGRTKPPSQEADAPYGRADRSTPPNPWSVPWASENWRATEHDNTRMIMPGKKGKHHSKSFNGLADSRHCRPFGEL